MTCEHCESARREALDEAIARHLAEPVGLIPLLQELQALEGYLSPETLRAVASATGTPLSRLYGVATFYSQFHLSPRGRTIVKVCQGTACHVNGADELARVIGETVGLEGPGTTDDGAFTVENVSCLGCCGLAPVIVIDEDVHGPVSPKEARRAVKAAARAAAKAAEEGAGA